MINQSQPKRQSRLFLSHGASTREMQDVVERIATGLEEKGFDVFEYRRSSIEAGQRWRYCLLVALLVCDSAAVLLDDRARFRKWVRYEMEVLEARRDLEPDFPLATIAFETTSDTASVVEHLSLSMARTASISTRPDFQASLMKAINEYSEILDDVECKTCIEALVVERRIWERLHRLPPIVASRLLKDLQRAPTWEESDIHWAALDALDHAAGASRTDRTSDVGLEIGRAIVRRGLYAVSSITKNAWMWLNKEELGSIIDWLTPLMIPLRSVRPLADVFSRDSAQRGPYVVTGNSTQQVVAAIRRAWGVERGPSYRALIFQVPELGGEDIVGYLLSTVREELLRRFRGRLRHLPDSELVRIAAGTKIMPVVDSRDQNAALGFVIAAAHLITEEVIHQVRARFPDLVFILTQQDDESLPSASAVSLGNIGSGDLDFLIDEAEFLLGEIARRGR